MSRPDYIARLHAARHHLEWCDDGQRAGACEAYGLALVEASEKSGFAAVQGEAAVARDYGAWIKQERLPRAGKKQR